MVEDEFDVAIGKRGEEVRVCTVGYCRMVMYDKKGI